MRTRERPGKKSLISVMKNIINARRSRSVSRRASRTDSLLLRRNPMSAFEPNNFACAWDIPPAVTKSLDKQSPPQPFHQPCTATTSSPSKFIFTQALASSPFPPQNKPFASSRNSLAKLLGTTRQNTNAETNYCCYRCFVVRCIPNLCRPWPMESPQLLGFWRGLFFLLLCHVVVSRGFPLLHSSVSFYVQGRRWTLISGNS